MMGVWVGLDKTSKLCFFNVPYILSPPNISQRRVDPPT